MPIYKDSKKTKVVYYGGSLVKSAYYGTNKIYTKPTYLFTGKFGSKYFWDYDGNPYINKVNTATCKSWVKYNGGIDACSMTIGEVNGVMRFCITVGYGNTANDSGNKKWYWYANYKEEPTKDDPAVIVCDNGNWLPSLNHRLFWDDDLQRWIWLNSGSYLLIGLSWSEANQSTVNSNYDVLKNHVLNLFSSGKVNK